MELGPLGYSPFFSLLEQQLHLTWELQLHPFLQGFLLCVESRSFGNNFITPE